MKVLTIVGARPQFIKATVVSSRMTRADGIDEVLVHTGQHYDNNMSDLFFRQLAIPAPTYHLGIGSGSHGVQTGKMLAAIDQVLLNERPDWVLIYGDTNSTLSGALSAAKLHVPVAHVEAGLRSFNRAMPEEINRIVADHCSDLLFAPTDTAVRNLLEEGIPSERVQQVGDVMYDAALFFGNKADRESRILSDLGLDAGHYILATTHRAENTDDSVRLAAIMEGLSEVSETIPVVLPLHPRTKHALSAKGMTPPEGIRFIEPIGYLDMVALERHAAAVATDSGGVQKEAFFYKVPCVTLRDETEWTELVNLGWNRLAPPVSAEIVSAAIVGAIGTRGLNDQPYGDGQAARRILSTLLHAD